MQWRDHDAEIEEEIPVGIIALKDVSLSLSKDFREPIHEGDVRTPLPTENHRLRKTGFEPP